MYSKYTFQITTLIVAGTLLFIGEFYQSPDAWKWAAQGMIGASILTMAWYEFKARREARSK